MLPCRREGAASAAPNVACSRQKPPPSDSRRTKNVPSLSPIYRSAARILASRAATNGSESRERTTLSFIAVRSGHDVSLTLTGI
jgi:hypothetical protein